MRIAELRFLVAEDDEFQRRVLVRILTSLGAKHVMEASDGRAALRLFRDRTRPVDIIVSDLDMPGMDGMEFIRHVGETGIPVSMILSSALESSLVSSVQAMTKAYGIDLLGAIEKPATPRLLRALIATYRPATMTAPKGVEPTCSLEEVSEGLRSRQFEPFFQPKVELATGRIKGAEALARWRRPGKGVVAPVAFIKVLEDNGMIDELTWVMLEKSADFWTHFRAEDADATVSVNLSLRSLTDAALADRVTDVVRAQRLEPRFVILEITETVAMTDIARALENLARLRLRGFGLSIDDYGTGYSSMQQLSRVPYTELKIDQSFVANATKQTANRVILRSSLDMARKLKLRAVAEGVETREDWNLLRRLGCDFAQGYFVARPLEAEAFLGWTKNWLPPGA